MGRDGARRTGRGRRAGRRWARQRSRCRGPPRTPRPHWACDSGSPGAVARRAPLDGARLLRIARPRGGWTRDPATHSGRGTAPGAAGEPARLPERSFRYGAPRRSTVPAEPCGRAAPTRGDAPTVFPVATICSRPVRSSFEPTNSSTRLASACARARSGSAAPPPDTQFQLRPGWIPSRSSRPARVVSGSCSAPKQGGSFVVATATGRVLVFGQAPRYEPRGELRARRLAVRPRRWNRRRAADRALGPAAALAPQDLRAGAPAAGAGLARAGRPDDRGERPGDPRARRRDRSARTGA